MHRVVPENALRPRRQGPEEEEIRKRVHAVGLDGTILLAGYREDALRITAAFDMFARSSWYEGLSIALIEAMALGKPSVVTDAGGVPEVVENGARGSSFRSDA